MKTVTTFRLERLLHYALASLGCLALCLAPGWTSSPAQANAGVLRGHGAAGLAARLDAYLTEKASPLSGSGTDFVASGERFDVDPRLVVAIAGAETSFGQRMCADYNAWNWFYQDTNQCSANAFASWTEGIERVSRGLGGATYLGGSVSTIEAIAAKYTATERDIWIQNVTQFYQVELAGDLTNLHFKPTDLEAGPDSAPESIAASTASDDPTLSGLDGFGMGSSTHLRLGADQLAAALDRLQRMGVRWVREEIPWNEIEVSRGTFRWAYGFEDPKGTPRPRDFDLLLRLAEERGLQVVLVLDYRSELYDSESFEAFSDAWGAYVQAVVDRYGDRVDAWEILNETNSRFYWDKVLPGQAPNAATYAVLLKRAQGVIKASDPDDTVVLGGLAGYRGDLEDCATNYFAYLQALHAAGAWSAFDVVAVHPYRESGEAPDAWSTRGLDCQTNSSRRYRLSDEVAALQALVDGYGHKPIWVTEIGWHRDWLTQRAVDRGGTAATIRADYLIRTYVSLLAAGVEKVFWYSLEDTTAEKGWAVDPEAEQAYQTLATLFAGSTPLPQVRGQSDQGHAADDDVYEYRFSRGAQIIIVLWKARGGDVTRTVTVTNLPTGSQATWTDASSADATGQVLTLSPDAQLELTERPIWIVVDLPSSPAPEPWTFAWPDLSGWVEGLGRDLQTWVDQEIQQAEQAIVDTFTQWVEQEAQRAWQSFWQGLCGSAPALAICGAGWAWRRRQPRHPLR